MTEDLNPTDPPISNEDPPAAEAPPTEDPPSIEQVHAILDSVITDVAKAVAEQTKSLQKLLDAEAKQRGLEVPVAQVTEEWIHKQVEAAFASGKIAELKEKLVELLKDQHGPSRRNPAAIA